MSRFVHDTFGIMNQLRIQNWSLGQGKVEAKVEFNHKFNRGFVLFTGWPDNFGSTCQNSGVLAKWSNLYPRTVLKSVPEDQILTAKSMLDILCWKNYKKKSWPSYQTLTGWKDRMKVSLSACHTIGRNNVQEPLQDGGPVYKIGRPLRGCVISADLAGTKKRPP